MIFFEEQGALIGKSERELLRIEGWGTDALRVQSTQHTAFWQELWALEDSAPTKSRIVIGEHYAYIENGRICAELNEHGVIQFFRDGKLLLSEYSRTFDSPHPHAPCLKVQAREYHSVSGSEYRTVLRFNSDDSEKIYGMGQYQQEHLNLKGCVLELAQRNGQITVPFAVSNKGYGFLWNNPGIGEATFGTNFTKWEMRGTPQMDYWITTGDNPKDILRNYTAVTGRSPKMPEHLLGLWQSKLRYRTQEEVLSVAREYHKRGLPLDVIVIDFFHWIRQGDWSFDPEYWPDPKAMVQELEDMGTACMVSVWPTVDRNSVNFQAMAQRGMLIRTERGSNQTFDFLGDTRIYDSTNQEARDYIWEQCNTNYYQYGIRHFWLDEAEPEYIVYDYDHYRYHLGPVLSVGNVYPKLHAKAFYDGVIREGNEKVCNLIRSAWAGSQKYASLVWSGDIRGSFECLRDQFAAGLHMGLAGIPWWVSDTGGFFSDVTDPGYKELMIRWFQYGAFCPVLRMHGDRGPHQDPPLVTGTNIGGGFCFTGRSNEIWSYGEDAYEIMKKYLLLRVQLKHDLMEIMNEASLYGYPVMRTMFFEYPEDPQCWELTEQYMLGSKYLVAPVLHEHHRQKSLYLPEGNWKELESERCHTGGQWIRVEAPLDMIPVFIRMEQRNS